MTLAPSLRPMRFDGDRRLAFAIDARVCGSDEAAVAAHLEAALRTAEQHGAALAYGVADGRLGDEGLARLGWTSLGPAPELVRPLRLPGALRALPLPRAARERVPSLPLLLPLGRQRHAGVRELTGPDPRLTRLWDRFSIDVGAAIERSASYVNPRIWERDDARPRVLVLEDGDRYVMRALCIFKRTEVHGRVSGQVVELLHDRSVAGMRAASHLLGLSLRELSDAGAEEATAWSFVHSGTFPVFARHGFFPLRAATARPKLAVRAIDPATEELVTQRHHWYVSGLDLDDVGAVEEASSASSGGRHAT